jgi:hypothetical protein
LFTACTSLALLGLGIVGKATTDDLALQAMPWKGPELSTWLVVLGLAGILAVAIAYFLKGLIRILLLIWNLAWMVMMVRGNFMLPGKSYATVSEFQWTIAYTAGVVLSFIGAFLIFRKKQ